MLQCSKLGVADGLGEGVGEPVGDGDGVPCGVTKADFASAVDPLISEMPDEPAQAISKPIVNAKIATCRPIRGAVFIIENIRLLFIEKFRVVETVLCERCNFAVAKTVQGREWEIHRDATGNGRKREEGKGGELTNR
jgi:hypothetical protein